MGIHPYAGAGMGVLSTWGTPEWRLVAGVRLVPSELADGIRGDRPADRDRDGIPDDTDRCPVEAGEGWARGCPETSGIGKNSSPAVEVLILTRSMHPAWPPLGSNTNG